MKKILIISNNPLGKINHNAKTLLSFFKECPKENLRQIYFQDKRPEGNFCDSFYRITDREIVKSFLKRNYDPGEVIEGNYELEEVTNFKGPVGGKKGYFFRLLREMIWFPQKWKTDKLKKYVTDFNPDIVFFMAGDSCFAYKICEYVCEEVQAECYVYITDDYILKRPEISPSFWIRRRMIFTRMKKCVQKAQQLFVISDEMKECYKKILGKDGKVVGNLSPDLSGEKVTNSRYELVYTGGLHYNRWKTLSAIGHAIEKYNMVAEKKAYLSIYCAERPNEKVLKVLTVQNASGYSGGLTSGEVKDVLQKADIAVHVESFDKKSSSATKLSLSTKIPEYLSLKKCIFAVGPEDVASMRYLADCAYCVTQKDSINGEKIAQLIDYVNKGDYARDAYEKYKRNHTRNVIGELCK